jgi:hypothetical protein
MRETIALKIRELLIHKPSMKTSAIVRKLKCGVSTVYAVKAQMALEERTSSALVRPIIDVDFTSRNEPRVAQVPRTPLTRACETIYTLTKNNQRLCITFDSRIDGVEIMLDEELYRVPMPEFEGVIEAIKHIQAFHQDFNNEVKGE